MVNIRDLWDQGIKVIHHPDGSRGQLNIMSNGWVCEAPIPTEEFDQEREIEFLNLQYRLDTSPRVIPNWIDDIR